MEDNKNNDQNHQFIQLIDNGFNDAYYQQPQGKNTDIILLQDFKNNVKGVNNTKDRSKILANMVASAIVDKFKNNKQKGVRLVLSIFLHGARSQDVVTKEIQHNIIYDNIEVSTLDFYNNLLEELNKHKDTIDSAFINGLFCNGAAIGYNTKHNIKANNSCSKELESAFFSSTFRRTSIEKARFIQKEVVENNITRTLELLELACMYGMKVTFLLHGDDGNIKPVYVKFPLSSVQNPIERIQVFNNALNELSKIKNFCERNKYTKDDFELIKKDFAKKFTQQQNNNDERFKANFVAIFDKLAYNSRRADKILKYEEFCRSDKVQDVLTKVLTMIETDNNRYEKDYKELFLNLLLFIEPQAAMNALYIDKEGKLTKFGNQFIELTKKLGYSKAFYYKENLNHNHAVNYQVISKIKALETIVEKDEHMANISRIKDVLYFRNTKNYDRWLKIVKPLIKLINKDEDFLNKNGKKLSYYNVSFDDITDERFALIEKHFLSPETMSEEHGLTIGKVMIPFFTAQKDLDDAKNFDAFLDMYVKKIKDMIKSEKLDPLLLKRAHNRFRTILNI